MDIVGGGDGVVGWRTWSEFVGRGLGGLIMVIAPPPSSLDTLAITRQPSRSRPPPPSSPYTSPPHPHTCACIHIHLLAIPTSHQPHPSQPLITNSHLITKPHHPHPAINHHTPPIPVPAQTPTCTGRRPRPACHPHIARWRCLRPPAAEDETQTHAPSTTMPRTSATQPSSLSCNHHARPSIPSTPSPAAAQQTMPTPTVLCNPITLAPLIAHQHSVLLYPDLPHTSPPPPPVLRIVLDQARAAGQLFFAGRRATSA